MKFIETLAKNNLQLVRGRTEILQLNLGKLCNLTCVHCHVNAGPKRKEIMTRQTMEQILNWLSDKAISTVDLTGGAPEMVPDFKFLITKLRRMPQIKTIIDRCNLTILLEPGYDGMIDFLKDHRVKIVASLPCYEPANVDAQRGDGVFDGSIKSLQKLNQVGYGLKEGLELDLVYNPVGDRLPPPQAELENDYKAELRTHFGIEFNRLYTITNMPIARFGSWLRNNGRLGGYMFMLEQTFNPQAVDGLMCRHTLSVDWRGLVYDCDFNQQLDMKCTDSGRDLYVWELVEEAFENRPILMADHCFGCTAGSGSSCGGAII